MGLVGRNGMADVFGANTDGGNVDVELVRAHRAKGLQRTAQPCVSAGEPDSQSHLGAVAVYPDGTFGDVELDGDLVDFEAGGQQLTRFDLGAVES